MKWLQTLKSILKLKDLRNKIIAVILLIVYVRVFSAIPLPGIDREQLKIFFQQNEAFGLLNMFTGGGLDNFSIALMGVGPYITATIIMQLLNVVVPKLEELSKEGDAGRQKINQWTRWLTIPLSFIQCWGTVAILQQQNVLTNLDLEALSVIILLSTTSTIILMWIGELISEKGLGNGLSMIITIGILSAVPDQIRKTILAYTPGNIQYVFGIIAFLVIALLTFTLIIYISESVRNIPISYTRHIRGNAQNNTGNSLPLKINAAGVIPIIFAISFIAFPPVIAQFFEHAKSDSIVRTATFVKDIFNNEIFYAVLYFILIFGFTYFYTFIIFKPDQIAENLQKQGGFIPGIRPGKETEEYVHQTLSRITLFGAVFLGVVAVLPIVIQDITKVNTLKLGGTSIIILVSVTLETVRQVRAQIISRTYELK